jgi:ubiquinol-cytochrome c reductase cytochrome b subunit
MSTTQSRVGIKPTVAAKAATGGANYVDERLASAGFVKRSLRKVFPDHWSFMLGEIALYSFVILLLTGTFLTFFYKPSATEVLYQGSYPLLRDVKMSEAYASTLDLSFDVRGGLLMRQIHHWAALIFLAAISVHLLRVFFTGAFRKPREFNWIIGVGLLVLAILEGFAGYSLPDDLLSGTGLRIAHAIILGIPVVGTYVAFLVFGGQFPGEEFIPRLYTVHVLLIPGIILALITAHLMMVWYQKHTQYPGPGRTETNVVGYPLMPVYMAKAGGFFFLVFGITALMGGLATINPIWAYGPYNPSQVSAGSQPDWYMGWLDGAVRTMPNWESSFWGHTISWNVFVPTVVIPGLVFTSLALYPFLEAWITGDKREHHLLDRPRNQPVRTAIGVMAITFYTILWINGGNDIIATRFGLSISQITWIARFTIILGPPIAFIITKRICLGLQRRDRLKVLHGRESGLIKRLPHGEFVEVHKPVSAEERWLLTQHEVREPLPLDAGEDAQGVRNPAGIRGKIRAKLSSFYYEDRVEVPTEGELRQELESGAHHAEIDMR